MLENKSKRQKAKGKGKKEEPAMIASSTEIGAFTFAF